MTAQPTLWVGERVRLAAIDAEKDAAVIAAWSHNDELLRLLDTDPARMRTAAQTRQDTEELQGKEQPKDNYYLFLIRALAGDRPLGLIDLVIPEWPHRDGWIGIGLGDRADWGQGYGTDAMRVLLRFAFAELNLHRVSLTVFGYNPRAIRSYEKAGFVVEGIQRERLRREGRRWDMVLMGLLREEWER